MALVRIDHHPTGRQLTVFSTLWLVFVGGWAIAIGLRNGWTAVPIGLASAAVVVPVVRMLFAEPIRWLYVASCYAAFPIGWVVSHVLLATIYYGVMTPIGVVMRAFGYDPMSKKLDREAESYWTRREPTTDRQRYFKQF